MHAPLDVAELDESEGDDEQHQHDRLRSCERVVLTLKAVGINLVDHEISGAGRTASGRDVDDAEGIHEAVGDVDDD